MCKSWLPRTTFYYHHDAQQTHTMAMRCLLIVFCVLAVVGCLLVSVAFPGATNEPGNDIAMVTTSATTPAKNSNSNSNSKPQTVNSKQQQQQHPPLTATTGTTTVEQNPSHHQPSHQHQQHRQQQKQRPVNGKLMRYILAAPEYKLLWCTIAKVGSSSVAGAINNLRSSLPETPPDVQLFLRTGRWSGRLRALMPHNAPETTNRFAASLWGRSSVISPAVNVTAEDVTVLLADDSWTKVLFVREPVERFLSAFVSKCQPGHDAAGNCVLADKMHPHISFATLMERARALFAAQQLDKALFFNAHWRPQARSCGGLTLDTNLPHYNAVYRYSSSTFGADTADALLRAGVERNLVEAVLPQALNGGGWNPGGGASHVTGAGGKLCKYFRSVEEVEEVMGWYREDYEAFGEVLAQQPSVVERYKEECGQKN